MSQPKTVARLSPWAGPVIALGILLLSIVPFLPSVTSRLGDISHHLGRLMSEIFFG